MYRFLVILNVVVFSILVYRFDRALTSGEVWFLFRLLMLISVSVIMALLYDYARSFKRNRLFIVHGVFFLILSLISVLHVIDYFAGLEVLGTSRTLMTRLVYLQVLVVGALLMPVVMDRLRGKQAQARHAGTWNSEIAVLYLFSTVYPIQHYIINNVDAFSAALIIQFVLVAALLPALVFAALFFYVRPVATEGTYYLANMAGALAIFSWYMRPLFRQFSIALSDTVGFTFNQLFLQILVFLVLFGLGCKIRRVIAPFLSVLLVLAMGNLAYTLYANAASSTGQAGQPISGKLLLKKTPSIYILVVDAYENRESLGYKDLGELFIGPDLAARGFYVYDNAYSNYKPSVPSLRAFFDMEHHHYRSEPDWQDLMTGNNQLYSVLKENGYQTVIAHPNDYLLQGHCKSDLCYPSPGVFGQIGFILAETIFYRTGFTERTGVGKGKFRRDFYQILEQADKPVVLYSHALMPAHGPRGCQNPEVVLNRYAEGLQQANEWIDLTVHKIESIDDDAIIIIFGDHGAFISDNCTWSDPDVTSRKAISDNMGILMAVKWPKDYDNRYDAQVHTLMDLSWYLLQYLSADGLDEDKKPGSTSFLIRESEKRIYKVTEDGVIISNSTGVRTSETGENIPAN